MALSPFSAFAAEGSGTNGLSFYDYLAAKADKETAIDFNLAPVDENNKPVGGLYLLQSTKNEEKPMYFYRGNVENNNVIFNDMCWLIVRTTETGGTKLLYNGYPTEGQCVGDSEWTMYDYSNMISGGTKIPNAAIAYERFNEKGTSPGDLGYMYGERYEPIEKEVSSGELFGNSVTYSNGVYTLQDTVYGAYDALNAHHYTCFSQTSSSCSSVYYAVRLQANPGVGRFFQFTDGETIETAVEKMLANDHDSVAKQTIETWFEDNMLETLDYLEDTVWYGGKTFVNGSLYSKDVDYSSDFDLMGTSYTKVDVDAFFNGVSRDNGTALPLIRTNEMRDPEEPEMSQVDYLTANVRNAVPSFDYSDERGKYTVSTENGNGKLKYPIGMLTASEMMLGGNGYPGYSKDTYLSAGFYEVMTMSPAAFNGDSANISILSYAGFVSPMIPNRKACIRPAISLKSTLSALEGDGSKENPFHNLVEATESDEGTPVEDESTPANPQTSDAIIRAIIIAAIGLASIIILRKQLTKRAD